MDTHETDRPVPKLAVFSIPKSGTHLLQQIVLGLPRYNRVQWVTQSGNIEQKIMSSHKHTIIFGHLYFSPQLKKFLDARHIRRIFIYRDPRDMVVSFFFYVMTIDHDHHLREYFNRLKSDDARIMKLITGFSGGYRDLNQQFYLPFMGWLQDPQTCALKYEDLVQNQISRRNQINRVVDYLWNDLQHLGTPKPTIAEGMEKNINPAKSPTFRKGKTGDWKRYFTEQHKAVFKKVAGQLLIDLGYEKDFNW